MEEVVDLSGGKVTIGTISFGDGTMSAAKSVVYKAGSPSHQDVVLARLWRLSYSVKEGFVKGRTVEETYNNVYALSKTDGEALWEAYRKLNEVSLGEGMGSDNSSLSEETQETI